MFEIQRVGHHQFDILKLRCSLHPRLTFTERRRGGDSLGVVGSPCGARAHCCSFRASLAGARPCSSLGASVYGMVIARGALLVEHGLAVRAGNLVSGQTADV